MKILQILVLLFSLTTLANAQTSKETTVLTGLVYDDMGAVITNVKVSAKDESGKVYLATTNNEGIYWIELSEGIYDLEFDVMYFKKIKLKKYRVVKAYQNKMYLDVALKPRAVDLYLSKKTK